MTCMSMYKSTEIFIPVKVDAQLHLCPPLPAPTSSLLLADCPSPTVPSPQLLRPLGVAERRRQRPCLHQHPGVRRGFSRSAAPVGIAAVPCLSSRRSHSCQATLFGQEQKETIALRRQIFGKSLWCKLGHSRASVHHPRFGGSAHWLL